MSHANGQDPRQELQRRIEAIQAKEFELHGKKVAVIQTVMPEFKYVQEYARVARRKTERYLAEVGQYVNSKVQTMFVTLNEMYEAVETVIDINLNELQLEGYCEKFELNDDIFLQVQEECAEWREPMQKVRQLIKQPLDPLSDEDVQKWTDAVQYLLAGMIRRIRQLDTYRDDLYKVQDLARQQIQRSQEILEFIEEHHFEEPSIEQIKNKYKQAQERNWQAAIISMRSFESVIDFLIDEFDDDRAEAAINEFDSKERREGGCIPVEHPVEFTFTFDEDNDNDNDNVFEEETQNMFKTMEQVADNNHDNDTE